MKFSDLNCLVTGGAGFIGSHIAQSLFENGSRITIVDDLSTGRIENIRHLLEQGVEFEKVNVLDKKKLRRCLKDIDFVFHQAAFVSVPGSIVNSRACNEINVTGTLNVLEQSLEAGVKKVVYAASSSAYGDTEVLPHVESMKTQALSPYGVSKLAAENYCRVYNSVYNLPTTSLRYFNVYGPRQSSNSEYAAVIPTFIKLLSEDKRPLIYGDGLQSRDFIFIADVAQANLNAALSEKSNGQVINVGTGSSTSIRDLLIKIAKIMKSSLEPIYTPAKEGEISHSFADISRAKALIDYEPRYSLEKGLELTIASTKFE